MYTRRTIAFGLALLAPASSPESAQHLDHAAGRYQLPQVYECRAPSGRLTSTEVYGASVRVFVPAESGSFCERVQ